MQCFLHTRTIISVFLYKFNISAYASMPTSWHLVLRPNVEQGYQQPK